jgi:hypothetical protein
MIGTAAHHFLSTIVPEARGLKASALAGAALLYAIPDEAFALA